MDTYGFHPNSPSLLRKPPPVKKGEVQLQHIMETLATKHQSCIVLATVFDLTRIYPTEVRIDLLVYCLLGLEEYGTQCLLVIYIYIYS